MVSSNKKFPMVEGVKKIFILPNFMWLKMKSSIFSVLLLGPIFYSFCSHSFLKTKFIPLTKNYVKLLPGQTMEMPDNNISVCNFFTFWVIFRFIFILLATLRFIRTLKKKMEFPNLSNGTVDKILTLLSLKTHSHTQRRQKGGKRYTW